MLCGSKSALQQTASPRGIINKGFSTQEQGITQQKQRNREVVEAEETKQRDEPLKEEYHSSLLYCCSGPIPGIIKKFTE